MIRSNDNNPPALDAEPAWEIARLFPNQGSWSEQQYFALDTNQIVEFDQGRIEVHTVPSMQHQWITRFLFRALLLFVESRSLGEVFSAPTRVTVGPKKYREPDVFFVTAAKAHLYNKQSYDVADLVIEVVSDDRPERDLVEKPIDYAAAGIGEYWIVDPRTETVSIFELPPESADAGVPAYRLIGQFHRGRTAASVRVRDFELSVDEIFDAGHGVRRGE